MAHGSRLPSRAQSEPLAEPGFDLSNRRWKAHRALADAGKRRGDLDGIMLVGGAARTPLVSSLLEEATGFTPRDDLHPDLCVALGAGVQAARTRDMTIERVLVNVSPWSFVLNEQLHLALENGNHDDVAYLSKELEDFLFFIEER